VTRTEVLEALRAAGYTGPVSYTKARLEELLGEQTGEPQAAEEPLSELYDLVPEEDRPTPGRAKVRGRNPVATAIPFDNEEVESFYGSIKHGDDCKISGQQRAKFTFVRYYKSDTQEYVEVRGGKSGHVRTRCFKPDLLRTMKGKMP
jgi:hypothetical protein